MLRLPAASNFRSHSREFYLLRTRWDRVTNARNKMPTVVAVSGGGAAGVGDFLHRVVGVVVPCGRCAGILLGDVLRLQTAVVIRDGRILVRAATFRSGILAYLRYLITNVVRVDGCGIDTAALP